MADFLWYKRDYGEKYHKLHPSKENMSLCETTYLAGIFPWPEIAIPKDKLCQKCLSIVAINPNR